jgi:hypothetical protein
MTNPVKMPQPATRTRKPRSDSAAAAINAAKNAALGDPMPPDHVQLSADALDDYRAIVRARARDEWSEYDLIVAAQMAECIARQRDYDAKIALEGEVIENAKGTLVANPMVSMLERLAGRQLAYTRILQMGGRVPGTAGDKRKKQNGRQLERTARALADEVVEDDLLS